jgi:uncharacterized membrane protein
MEIFVLGLVVFLGTHSLRIFADGKRTQLLQEWGEKKFKMIYTLVSLLTFGFMLWGYGQARLEPVQLWVPPVWGRHVAFLLVWVAWVLMAGAFIHANWFKVKMHHPMMLSVKTWALAHLLANGQLHQVLLFGGFLIWGVLAFISARRRDRAQAASLEEAGLPPSPEVPVSGAATQLTLAIGTLAYVLFLAWGHKAWIGVSPLGM